MKKVKVQLKRCWQVGNKKTIKIIVVVFLPLLAAALFHFYAYQRVVEMQSSVKEKTKSISENVAATVGRYFRDKHELEGQLFDEVFQNNPFVGYIIVDNRVSGFRTGALNRRAIEMAPKKIKKILFGQEFTYLLNELVRTNQGGASTGFDVVQVFVKDENHPGDPAALVLKFGYVIPIVSGWQQRAIYSYVLAILLIFVVLRFGVLKQKISQTHGEKEEVDLLDTPSTDNDTAIIAINRPKHLRNENWIALYQSGSLSEWKKQGEWYAFTDCLFANPWAASLVRQEYNFENYIYRLKAKKVVGSDGFIVSFNCDKKPLFWVLGGWNNSASELAGHPETRSDDTINVGQWYEITIEVLPSMVLGYLNGNRVWQLSRTDIAGKQPVTELLAGIGVSTWNTVCKFQDLFIAEKIISGEDDNAS